MKNLLIPLKYLITQNVKFKSYNYVEVTIWFYQIIYYIFVFSLKSSKFKFHIYEFVYFLNLI